MHRFFCGLLLFLICVGLAVSQTSSLAGYLAPISVSNPGWLMAAFYADCGVAGCETITLNQSYDAGKFFFNGFSTYNCYGGVRDPSIAYVTISGTAKILLAHTASGAPGCFNDSHHIAFSSATAGTTTSLAFANQVQYDCSVSMKAGFCWAPEIFVDPANCTFAHGSGWTCSSMTNIHIYVASSTNTTCCSAFTLYEMHCTATDCFGNTASWSVPVALTFASGTPVSIDPFMVCKNSVTGADCQNPAVANDQLYMWYNDKASSTGCINYGTIPGLTGAITPVMTGNCFGFANYVEGPAVLHVTPGSPGVWQVCMDNYQNTYNLGQLNCSYSTNNWSTWSAPNFFLLSPQQSKQGTIIVYP